MALPVGEASFKPSVASVGTVTKVDNLRKSKNFDKTGNYVIDVAIQPHQYPHFPQKVYFWFHPDWTDAGVDFKSLPEAQRDNYYRQINGIDATSVLKGLLGAELFESFNGFDNPTPEDLLELLQDNVSGRDVGFVLKQNREEIDPEVVVDTDTGEEEEKRRFVRTNSMSIDGLFVEGDVSRLESRATRAEAKAAASGNGQISGFQLAWDIGVSPFS